MKSFYEQNHGGKFGFKVNRNGDYVFPSHFHQNLEIFICLSGEQSLTINGESVRATSGSVVIIDNYAVHSYGEQIKGDQCVLIIPYDYLTEFNTLREGKVFEKIQINNFEYAKKIMNLIDENLTGSLSYYQIYSTVNMIMAMITTQNLLIAGENVGENELINKILSYVENNFKEDITLKSLSKEFGYAEGHLSRIFHRYVKSTFPSYVNQRRLDYVQQKLSSKNKALAELIFESGFKSFQTYYRTKNAHKQ